MNKSKKYNLGGTETQFGYEWSHYNEIIPEYKIHLLNKNKKIINKIESFKTIAVGNKNNIININKAHKKNKKKSNEGLGKILWTRRRKRLN